MPETRNEAAATRDTAADARDHQAEHDDHTATDQDVVSLIRDGDGVLRDGLSTHRDAVADDREMAWRFYAESFDDLVGSSPRILREVLVTAAHALEQAAADRVSARADRTNAGFDRASALADRLLGAGRRAAAESYRQCAGGDRTASKNDRQAADLDGLSHAYSREAGMVELRRDLVRARESLTRMVIAYIEVDDLESYDLESYDLESYDGPERHVALDGDLARVVTCVRHHLKPYDIVVRLGRDQLLCVLSGFEVAEAAAVFVDISADLRASRGGEFLRTGFAQLEADDTEDGLIMRARADIPAASLRG